MGYGVIASPGFKPKREVVKSGYSGALRQGTLDLSCKANKCSDTETGDLGVLLTHETSPCLYDLNPLRMNAAANINKKIWSYTTCTFVQAVQ